MSKSLVLSLFPGGGLLDYAFEQEGFTIVRGPDPLWGGDIRTFHPPKWVWDGIIGGPPCQTFSPIGNVNKARYGDDSVMPDLIPEFARVVREVEPSWWLMECSPHAYAPFSDCESFDLDEAWLGSEQRRRRKFWTNLPIKACVHSMCPTLVSCDAGSERTVSSAGSVDWKGSRAAEPSRSLGDMLRLQGLPGDWLDHQPWTMQAKRKIVGNGVAVPTGRALARAIHTWEEER